MPSAQTGQELPLQQPRLRTARWLRALVVLSWAGLVWAIGSLYLQQRLGLYYAITWLWLPAALSGVAAGVILLLLVLWGTLQRPRRNRVLAWGMIGIAPLVLWGASAALLLNGRSPRIAHKVGHMAASSLVPLFAEWYYPHRLESERLLMYYHDQVADPAGDIAAMEEHLARLEQILDRQQQAKIVWVRGPALLRERASINCVALGERGRREATNVDRHEVAHALLFQFTTPNADPPQLLVEGWARAVEGQPEPLAATAMKYHHKDLTLEYFLSPEEYHHVSSWSYFYGGALVDYLLRLHGPDRFLDWYNSSRVESCLIDFQRVYGVSFRGVEEVFWRETEATSKTQK